ncbi:MAG: ribosome maturation factor RimP [Ruminococcaceae bacterium]|nr:ribosome maturation factor RimP [Oscillospiraceae bacterium]
MANKKSAASPKNIAGLVETLVRDTVEKLGYTLWDVDYSKEGVDWNLTVFIDKPGTEIGIDDCVTVHHAIDPIIDEADPIKDFYYLQVSTAGIERTLTRPEHYELYAGKEIDIKFFAPQEIEGVKLKSLRAVLEKYENKIITINYEGKIFELDEAVCASVKSAE